MPCLRQLHDLEDDPVTRRCRHYEFRPLACMEFEIGEFDCLDARRREGIG